jgi:hypothetical protein
LTDWEPWVKNIFYMSIAVDHPDDGPGRRLVTQNFNLGWVGDRPGLIDPTWGLSDQPQTRIVDDMSAVIEGTIELGEVVLAALFSKLKIDFPLMIYEIPVDKRDPTCPIRLHVNFEPGAYSKPLLSVVHDLPEDRGDSTPHKPA